MARRNSRLSNYPIVEVTNLSDGSTETLPFHGMSSTGKSFLVNRNGKLEYLRTDRYSYKEI